MGLGAWEYPFRVIVLSALLWVFSRRVIHLRPAHVAGSVGLGVVVFAVWIAPDLLSESWRQHWLFQNALTGGVESSIRSEVREQALPLVFRAIRAVLLVPVIEELFWRAWLMRWLINPSFQTVPLGTCRACSFWITALLFAAEHGPFWDVGLLAGIAYNWWMVRTRSLADCVLAHAVTNGILSAYVIVSGKWQYW